MVTRFEQTGIENGLSNVLGSWVMVVLTLMFVLLYATALMGWLKPLADEKMLARLEPIIFVIIGYYFSRLPSQQNENTLRCEIKRQTQKADAAQHVREQARLDREALEEKVKNAKATLTSAPLLTGKRFDERLDRAAGGASKDEALRQSIITALSVLNS